MTPSIKQISLSVVATTILLNFPTSAKAFTVYSEDVDGDLSNDRLATTYLGVLSEGTNSLTATFRAGTLSPDPDYFSFTIPKGLFLSEIKLNSWETSPSFEDIAFIAMERGKAFNFKYVSTATPGNRAEGLFGWSHLRSTQVGSNKILEEMAISDQTPESVGLDLIYQDEADPSPYTPGQLANLPDGVTEEMLISNLSNLATKWEGGASGFNLPLGPGDYSIWLRQGSDTQITVDLDFTTTTVPEPITMLGAGAALGMGAFFKREVSKKQNKKKTKNS